MIYTYETQGVCSRAIELDIGENGEIADIRFEGGCDGNAKGVRALVKGRKAQEVQHLLEGIRCADKQTSCPDQLSRALSKILEENNSPHQAGQPPRK